MYLILYTRQNVMITKAIDPVGTSENHNSIKWQCMPISLCWLQRAFLLASVRTFNNFFKRRLKWLTFFSLPKCNILLINVPHCFPLNFFKRKAIFYKFDSVRFVFKLCADIQHLTYQFFWKSFVLYCFVFLFLFFYTKFVLVLLE